MVTKLKNHELAVNESLLCKLFLAFSFSTFVKIIFNPDCSSGTDIAKDHLFVILGLQF